MLDRLKRVMKKSRFKCSAAYWEKRYARGGDSGVGSYGRLACYKADMINVFVEQKNVRSVIEFGCGDGNQLSLYEVPRYTGIDVSGTAVSKCKKIFENDETKKFLSYREFSAVRNDMAPADLTVSIDVIYHLVEDRVFEAHIGDLFHFASQYVIIYSTNFDRVYENAHQVDRHFTPYVEKNIHDFHLIETIVNPYKGDDTMSDFYIYERIGSEAECTS